MSLTQITQTGQKMWTSTKENVRDIHTWRSVLFREEGQKFAKKITHWPN